MEDEDGREIKNMEDKKENEKQGWRWRAVVVSWLY